jgi:hypothetical protein
VTAAWRSPQILPFGFCINVLTGDAGPTAIAAGAIFKALGLRTSRLLRRCDLAISVCSRFICPARGKSPKPLELMAIGPNVGGIGRGVMPHVCYLFTRNWLIETHGRHSHDKRGRNIPQSQAAWIKSGDAAG